MRDTCKDGPTLLTAVHRDGCGAIGGCTVTQLSVTVISPGIDRAGCGKGKALIKICRDLFNIDKISAALFAAAHLYRRSAIGGRPVT